MNMNNNKNYFLTVLIIQLDQLIKINNVFNDSFRFYFTFLFVFIYLYHLYIYIYIQIRYEMKLR
jgi:hypothetical protein